MLERLKQLRIESGLTCQQMAKQMGLTKATYYKKEQGQIKISLFDAKKISKILGHSIDNIFFTSDARAVDDFEND